MAEVLTFREGGYRYIKAVFQYSSGVAAEPGFEIERARLARPLPLAEGFALVEKHLKGLGRPSTAFCACELRSAKPFTERGFYDFNREYVKTLERWGIFHDDINPVARTNVCPAVEPPAASVLYAFSYTVPARQTGRGTFVIAGGAEGRDLKDLPRDPHEALRAKVRSVVASMQRRLEALGFAWREALSTQAYTARDIGRFLGDEIVRPGGVPEAVTWHYCRPPVEGLEVEMDVRATAREIVL